MCDGDFTATLDRALTASGLDRFNVLRRSTRLFGVPTTQYKRTLHEWKLPGRFRVQSDHLKLFPMRHAGQAGGVTRLSACQAYEAWQEA